MDESAEGVGGNDSEEPEYQENDEEGPEHTGTMGQKGHHRREIRGVDEVKP